MYFNCNGCPYFDGVPEDDCRYKAMANALALFREKDAEIERLKLDVEVLGAELSRYTENIVEMQKADRNRTITEFEERLLRFYDKLGGKTASGSVTYHIRQIANELRGGAE